MQLPRPQGRKRTGADLPLRAPVPGWNRLAPPPGCLVKRIGTGWHRFARAGQPKLKPSNPHSTKFLFCGPAPMAHPLASSDVTQLPPTASSGDLGLIRKLISDRRAGVMPLFALPLIPLLGFVGAAVDFSRANSVKAAMQAALDSTALMLSKDAARLDQDGLQTKAENYFFSMFQKAEA